MTRWSSSASTEWVPRAFFYADSRPEVNGWGKRGELRCETWFGLRKNEAYR